MRLTERTGKLIPSAGVTWHRQTGV